MANSSILFITSGSTDDAAVDDSEYVDPRYTDARISGEIFTIGYGLRSVPQFFEVLRERGVTHLIDVRTTPYSRYTPDFNREALIRTVDDWGIRYVHMGETLGGRPNSPTCYDDEGRVVYALVEQTSFFRRGIGQLGLAIRHENRVVCLMCSEGKPQDCHRTKLIGKFLWERGVSVKHITETNEVVDQPTAFSRIFSGQQTLFDEPLRSRKQYRGNR